MPKRRTIIHKNISPDAAHGRLISRVYDADKMYKAHRCSSRVPPKSKLFNFDIKFAGRTLLVLDNYGAHDGGIPPELNQHLFNGLTFGNDVSGVTLAIDKGTGQVFFIGFGVEQRKTIAIVWECCPGNENQLRVPQGVLKRLDELKSCKRPFRLLLDMGALCSFLIGETGYEHLRSAVTLAFDLRPQALEVTQDAHRFVGDWN